MRSGFLRHLFLLFLLVPGVVLADEIKLQAGSLLQADCQAHAREHSIEVQIPIIQYLLR